MLRLMVVRNTSVCAAAGVANSFFTTAVPTPCPLQTCKLGPNRQEQEKTTALGVMLEKLMVIPSFPCETDCYGNNR